MAAVAVAPLAAIQWVIPLTVTGIGTLAGHMLSKSTEQVSWFGGKRPPSETSKMTHTVRVWVGMQEHLPNETIPDDKLQGTIPWITLWGERGEFLAEKWPKEHVAQGEHRDIVIEGDVNRKPGYDHWDAMCISAIQMKWAGGGSAMIYGDVAAACGWPVYVSVTEVTIKDDETYQPWCMWLDWDDSRSNWPTPDDEGKPWLVTDGHFPASVNFHINDFMIDNTTFAAYRNDTDLMCKAGARLQAHPWMPKTISIYQPPLKYGYQRSPYYNGTTIRNNYLPNTKDQPGVFWPQSEARSMPGRKRDSRQKKPARDFSQAITTTGLKKRQVSAQALCGMKNAYGPSFVNVEEGKYCDMVNKVVLPVCSEERTHDCLLIEDKSDGEEEFRVIGPKPDVAEGDDVNLIAVPNKPVKKTYRKVNRMG